MMNTSHIRPSPASELQTISSHDQPRRSSLNFFRRVSSDKARTTTPMLFRRDTKQEVAPQPPAVKKPRIPSLHFDANGSSPVRFETPRSAYPASYEPTSPRRSNAVNRSTRSQHRPAMPAIPQTPVTPPSQDKYDPFGRTATMSSTMTASMKDRGRYGYSSASTNTTSSPPRRIRRKKDAQPFNVLVIGSKNCGKSSFIEFLRTSLAQPVKNRGTPSPTRSQSYYNTSFPCEYLETDIDGERVGLTLYDSQGLEKSIVDLQLQEMTSFIESKFEETFVQEQKVLRNAAAKDTHIHCVLLLLDPGRLHSTCNASYVRSSDEMSEGKKLLDATVDIEVLRTLHGLTTIVPIISKADTVTVAQMATLKRDLWQELSKLDFKPLSVLDFDSEETSASDSEDDWAQTEHQNDTDSLNTNDTFTRHTPKSTSIGIAVASLHSPTPSASPSSNKHEITDNDIPDIPMSIISPDVYEPDLVGRRFAWGFADPENSLHCDYPRLKESVFGDWRDDLREASKVRCYEKWRTSRLKRRISPATPHARSVSGGVQSVKKVNGGGVSRGMMANDIGVATSGLDDDQEVLDGIRKL